MTPVAARVLAALRDDFERPGGPSAARVAAGLAVSLSTVEKVLRRARRAGEFPAARAMTPRDLGPEGDAFTDRRPPDEAIRAMLVRLESERRRKEQKAGRWHVPVVKAPAGRAAR